MQIKSAKEKVQSLRIIIVGCGKVGHTLTEQLCAKGTISPLWIQTSAWCANDRCVRRDGDSGQRRESLSVLKEAGLEEADLVIAVTGSDELNLLCCTIAKRRAASWRRLRACATRITARAVVSAPAARPFNDYQPGAGGRAGNRAPALPPAGADGQRVCEGTRGTGALQDPQRGASCTAAA